jgi:stage V sporulation protein G
MTISEIQFIPSKPKDGLIGFCSFVLNAGFYVSSVAVYTRLMGGYRLVFPSKKVGSYEQTVCYPISKELGKIIEEKVTKKIEEVMRKDDRYDSINF